MDPAIRSGLFGLATLRLSFIQKQQAKRQDENREEIRDLRSEITQLYFGISLLTGQIVSLGERPVWTPAKTPSREDTE